MCIRDRISHGPKEATRRTRYHTDPKRRRDAGVRDATHASDTRTTRARRRAASAATQSATREPTRRTTQNDLARDDDGDRAERTRANPRAPTTRAERAGVDVGADAGRTTIGDRRRRRVGARVWSVCQTHASRLGRPRRVASLGPCDISCVASPLWVRVISRASRRLFASVCQKRDADGDATRDATRRARTRARARDARARGPASDAFPTARWRREAATRHRDDANARSKSR